MAGIDEIDRSDAATDRACLAVGKFLYHWSRLEGGIDLIILRLFKLDSLEGAIITANMFFFSKLNIVNTALLWQGRKHDEAWRKRARKIVARIGRLNRSRNLMAHNIFVPLKNGQVKFLKVEAKGEFAIPRIEWSPKDFERTYCLLDAADTELTKLTQELENRKALIQALVRSLSSSGGLFALGQLNPPPLPHSHPDSPDGQATPETSPQTAPSLTQKSAD